MPFSPYVSAITVDFVPILRVAEGSLLQLESVLTLIGTSTVDLRVTLTAQDGSAKGM